MIYGIPINVVCDFIILTVGAVVVGVIAACFLVLIMDIVEWRNNRK